MSATGTSRVADARSASGWIRRLLAFPPTRIGVGLVGFVVLLLPVQVALGPVSAMSPAGAAAEIYAGAAAVAALWLLARFVERRPLSDVGLPGGRAVSGVLAGLVIGAATAAGAVGLLAVTGSYTYAGQGDLSHSATDTGLLLVFEFGSAALQAIVFFAIVFRVLLEWLGRWPSIALSVVLFGILHLAGANATVWTAVVVGLAGGSLLALSYVLTRAVWLPMGLLWGLNLTLGEILGGIPGSHHSLFRAHLTGNDLWTGGAAGVEGGAAILIPAALAIGAMAWRTRSVARREARDA
jgi:membrane protease YdiL (CAAX protease family)